MRISDRVRGAVVRCWQVRCWSISRGADHGWGRAACVSVAYRGTERQLRRLARRMVARVPGATRVECRSGAVVATAGYSE